MTASLLPPALRLDPLLASRAARSVEGPRMHLLAGMVLLVLVADAQGAMIDLGVTARPAQRSELLDAMVAFMAAFF
jgi:hypothetical protein